MEVFTLCNCDNITNSYLAHCKQKLNRSHNQKKFTKCEWALKIWSETWWWMTELPVYKSQHKYHDIVEMFCGCSAGARMEVHAGIDRSIISAIACQIMLDRIVRVSCLEGGIIWEFLRKKSRQELFMIISTKPRNFNVSYYLCALSF